MYPVKLENKAFAITIDETKKNLLELRKAEQNYFKPEDYSKILQVEKWVHVTNPVIGTCRR